jgi:hypothetical protein
MRFTGVATARPLLVGVEVIGQTTADRVAEADDAEFDGIFGVAALLRKRNIRVSKPKTTWMDAERSRSAGEFSIAADTDEKGKTPWLPSFTWTPPVSLKIGTSPEFPCSR